MSKLSKNTAKRLTLLYVIGSFPKGIWGSKRLQKMLYFISKEITPSPFTFEFNHYGQYSPEAKLLADELVPTNLLTFTEQFKNGYECDIWDVSNREELSRYKKALNSIYPNFDTLFSKVYSKYGALSTPKLVKEAYKDLEGLQRHISIVITENMPDYIETDLSEEECEDLELMLNPKFVNAMKALVEAIETTDINWEGVKRVETIL